MLQKQFEVSTYLTNAQGKLGLYHLLNLLQDVAAEHAEMLGFGFSDMIRMNMFWVLTRQKLHMNYWPQRHEKIIIKTWLRVEDGPTSNREFSIFLNENCIGECTTRWVSLDGSSRRPVNFDRSKFLSQVEDLGTVSFDSHKIPTFDGELISSFKVRNSDIDLNMHVNNTKYAQWILDAIPFKNHFENLLTGYAVNFLSESKLSDNIFIEKGIEDTQEEDIITSYFQGRRESDRKIIFTAYLNYTKLRA